MNKIILTFAAFALSVGSAAAMTTATDAPKQLQVNKAAAAAEMTGGWKGAEADTSGLPTSSRYQNGDASVAPMAKAGFTFRGNAALGASNSIDGPISSRYIYGDAPTR